MGDKQRNTFLLDDGKRWSCGESKNATPCYDLWSHLYHNRVEKEKGCTETAAALNVPDEYIMASQLTTVANGANVDAPGAGWEIVSKGIYVTLQRFPVFAKLKKYIYIYSIKTLIEF